MKIHPGYSDGKWSVVRVNDDGRIEVVHNGLRGEAASLIAGALRDDQSDADVAAGWNVLPLGAKELKRRLAVSAVSTKGRALLVPEAEALRAGG